MDVRKFTLTNANGVSYGLLSKSRFLHSPTGLGFTENTTYQDFGSVFSVLDDGLEQQTISAYIVFSGSSRKAVYKSYFDFVTFCRLAPLTLEYSPIFDTFKRTCRVLSVEKSEIEAGVLECSIKLICLSQWYKEVSAFNSGEASGGKTYSYQYNYTYSNNIAQSVVLDNDGSEESPCKIVVYGLAVNPTWYHYVNGNLYSTGTANMTIAANHKLVIDTTETPYAMKELDMSNNLIRNAYQLSDFSTERFIRLQPGKNRITLTHSGSNVISIGVEGRVSYASV